MQWCFSIFSQSIIEMVRNTLYLRRKVHTNFKSYWNKFEKYMKICFYLLFEWCFQSLNLHIILILREPWGPFYKVSSYLQLDVNRII
jgi:hypothetical protein